MAYQYRQNRRRKYGNRKVNFDGRTFDSKKEAERYRVLKSMQELGIISDLQLQQKFILIPAQRIEGKLIERECAYIADFMYVDNDSGKTVVEDTKGVRTRAYIIKRKLMLWRFGIRIKEI